MMVDEENFCTSEAFAEFLAKSDAGPFYFDKNLINLFIDTVHHSPLTVVGGRFATGKTVLAEQFVEFIEQSGVETTVIQASTQWSRKDDLLGSYSFENNEYNTTLFLNCLMAALVDRERQHYVVIDSIDSGIVKGFLTDVVVALSSNRPMPIHNESRCVPASYAIPENRNLICHDDCFSCFFAQKNFDSHNISKNMTSFVPPHVAIPDNFHIIVTLAGETPVSGFEPWMIDKIHWIYLPSIASDQWIDHLSVFENLEKTHEVQVFLSELTSLFKEAKLHMGWRILRGMSQSLFYKKLVHHDSDGKKLDYSGPDQLFASKIFPLIASASLEANQSGLIGFCEKYHLNYSLELLNSLSNL